MSNMHVFSWRSLSIGLLMFSSPAVFADISGTVFRDFNANGVKDNTATFNEIGVGGVTVTAHGTSGVLGSATTAADGSYSIAGVTGAARVEFSNLPAGYYPTAVSKPVVQFVTAPVTDANLGLNYPSDYVGNPDPVVAVTHQAGGGPLINAWSDPESSASPSSPVVTIFNYSNRNWKMNPDGTAASGLGAGVSRLVANVQTGTIFGATYSPYSKKLFASAFLKRHSGLGTLGSGGIYMINPNGTYPTSFSDATSTNQTVTAFINLDNLGIQTNDPNTSSILHVKSNDDRGLPWATFIANNDASAFAQVGRVSLGDLELSEDGRYLFATNLYKKSVVKIDLQNATSPQTPTAAQVQEFAITPPTCANGEFHPFALKYYRNELYIGSVCDAVTSNNPDDVSFQVIKMNPSTGANSTVFSFGAYTKAHIYGFIKKWDSWLNDPTSASTLMQPMFTDLEMDVDGSLIMGFADRNGHQRGRNNYQPYSNDNEDVVIAGDILRASYNAATGVYTLENNGSDGTNTTAGAGNNQGPGGGEFYIGDTQKMPTTSTTPWEDDHKERSQGGLALLPGSGKVAMGTLNPKGVPWTNGVAWLSNTTGANTQEIFITDRLGKANGMGDIEILNDIPPIEIGNRVWLDTDKDGVQDADEAGIAGVSVKLMQGTTEIATATTAADGSYVFSSATGTSTASAIYGLTGLTPNTAYTLKFPLTVTVGAATYQLTKANSGTNTEIDSNASVTTGDVSVAPSDIPQVGANNYTFDVGYSSAPPPNVDLALTKVADKTNVKSGDTVRYTLTLSNISANPASGVEVTDHLPTGVTYKAHNAGQGTYTNSTGIWVVGALAAGASVTLTIDVTVD